MTVFAQAFLNDHNNMSDAMNEISPLLFRLIRQSHMTFLMRLEEFIHKKRFHLPLFALPFFAQIKKHLKRA